MDLLLVAQIISKVSDVEKLKKLVDPNMRDATGASILETVCASWDSSAGSDTAQTVSLLIQAGADVNYQNKAGWTALHFAATCRDASASKKVKLLLEAGANPNLKDLKGDSPILYMDNFLPNWETTFDLLINAGATLW
jgi:ankyrin repeat protein